VFFLKLWDSSRRSRAECQRDTSLRPQWQELTMKIKEIREKNSEELQHLLVVMREKLSKLRFDLEARKLKNNQEVQKTRKTIARILTILKEKEKKEK